MHPNSHRRNSDWLGNVDISLACWCSWAMMISWCIAPYAIDYRIDWLRVTDSNRRSGAYETPEIPLLQPAIIFIDCYVCPNNLVRDGRIELPTTVESGQDSTSELTAHIYGAPGGT